MTRRRRFSIPFLCIVVLAALVLAGCARKEKTTTGSKDTEEGSSSPKYTPAVVEASEYAFKVTGKLKAGETFTVRNTGKEFHMMGLGRLKAGKTLSDVQKSLETEDEADDEEAVELVGLPSSFIGPGSEVGITVPKLDPGTYAMVCFLNVEGEETPHFVKGMINQIEAVEGEGEGPEPDATYTASKGKAVTGPDSLKAGENVLKVEVGEGGEDLEPGLYKLNDGVTVEQFGEAAKLFDEGFPVDAASKLPGKVVIGMFDFGETPSVSLTVDLEPGTYVLVAEDSDVEETPPVPVELIKITVT